MNITDKFINILNDLQQIDRDKIKFKMKHLHDYIIKNYKLKEPMQVKIKKLNEYAVVPEYAKSGDAGLDLVATSAKSNSMYIEYGTSLAIEIPEGYVGLLFPRSSISKYHLSMANSVGVIDSGYRGEICVRFKKTIDNSYENIYNVGDKVAQLIIMPYPQIELVEVDDLSTTERGSGGFGSSGN